MKPKHPAFPPMTLGNMRELGVLGLAAVCVCSITGGCAFAPDTDTFSPYAEPGKYDFLDCPSIANRFKAASARERQLNELMTRASEDAGGAIVNAMVYQDDLNSARATQRSLRKAAEANNAHLWKRPHLSRCIERQVGLAL